MNETTIQLAKVLKYSIIKNISIFTRLPFNMKNLILELVTIISGIVAAGYFLEKFAPLCETNHCFQWALILAIFVAAMVTMYRIKRKTYCRPEGIAELEGPLPLNSRFYIERPPVEAECYEAISRPNALIRIRSPRQMGKSSLLIRIIAHAKGQGCRTVFLSLREADETAFANLDKFLQWFCISVTQKLGLPNDDVIKHWNNFLDSKVNASKYFQEYLLTESQPLVLGLDDLDLIFQYHDHIAKDFFGLLQTWHEHGVNDELWQKLRLVITHATEVPIPFHFDLNVGKPLELADFNPQQVQKLVQQYRFKWTATEVQDLMTMIGGHPYLIRLAFYKIVIRQTTLAKLLQNAGTNAGLFYKHLHHHLLALQNANLLTMMQQVAIANKPIKIDDTIAFKLYSMGLVELQDDTVIPRCDMYRLYFANLVDKHL